MDKSGNPALKRSALDRVRELESAQTATVGGTIGKIIILALLVAVGAAAGWTMAASSQASALWVLLGSAVVATIFALITIFVPKASPFTAPVYAAAEGAVLGAISYWANTAYEGIALQALVLTGAVFASVLVLYTTGIVRVTQKLRAVIIIATMAVALYYVINLVVMLFGGSLPLIYDSGTFGIIFSVIVVFIAAMNLLLDFDFIEKTAQSGAPKVFEWYGAFGLIVTLVWLYIEILRLLSKLKS
ncbi:Bax inhibitor-1/YccA family protein [Candidatus Saccharibacteria bacterium]|nr:MAG: Bax inhibitor-1/YccA family protein [Candidatus Saccharibacteria bacterium]